MSRAFKLLACAALAAGAALSRGLGPFDDRGVLLSARAAAALSSLSIHSIDDIRSHVHLPSSFEDLNITWSSSHPDIIAADGVVNRPDTNANVTLTATIEHDGDLRKRDFAAVVRKAARLDPLQGYAFFYFTNNTRAGERIYAAASEGNNALRWRELNAGRPVLSSTLGTTGLRDPFVIRSVEGDKFFLIATDLSIGSGTSWSDAVRRGSRYIEVWESTDLINWSAQRHVLVSPAEVGNTWAPEAYWEPSISRYVVFWASSPYSSNDPNRTGATYHRMYYATTRDFVTFSAPSVWQDAGMSRIDTTVIRDNGVYYRFTKDEGARGTGCSDIIQESSGNFFSAINGWSTQASCIGRKAGTQNVEGPTIFKANPGDANGQKFYLFVDEYTGRGYIPLESASLQSPQWRVSTSYSLPRSPRHGTVIPVTAAELSNLRSRLGARDCAPAKEAEA